MLIHRATYHKMVFLTEATHEVNIFDELLNGALEGSHLGSEKSLLFVRARYQQPSFTAHVNLKKRILIFNFSNLEHSQLHRPKTNMWIKHFR
jgi:hypothetical protein